VFDRDVVAAEDLGKLLAQERPDRGHIHFHDGYASSLLQRVPRLLH
jgi:hypothetical protein